VRDGTVADTGTYIPIIPIYTNSKFTFNNGVTTITNSRIKTTSSIFVQQVYSSGTPGYFFISQTLNGSANIYVKNGFTTTSVPANGTEIWLNVFAVF